MQMKRGIKSAVPAFPWITIILWVVVVVMGMVVGIQAYHREIKDLALAHPLDINDFNRWLRMLPGFLHHHKNFKNDLWPMPPFTIVLFSPFSLLSMPAAQFAWAFFKPVLLAIIFYSSLGIVRRCGVRIAPLPMALILAVWFWPVIGDMQEGQVNLLMLTPMAAGLWLAQIGRPKTDILAGLMLAMAVAIKVTPIIFLIYFLWRRRWRVAAAMVLGIPFWLYIPLAACFGPAQAILWNHQYFDIMIRPYILHGSIKVPSGESIPSFLLRLLAHVPAFVAYPHGHARNYYVNLFNLSPAAAQRIIRIVLVTIGSIGLVWMRRRLPTLLCRRYVLEIGAIAAFMLWAEEWSWVPHYVTLIFTLMAAGMVVSDDLAPRIGRRLCLAALILAAILMALTSDIIKIFGAHAANYGRTLDPALFAGFALVLAFMSSGYSRLIAASPPEKLASAADRPPAVPPSVS